MLQRKDRHFRAQVDFGGDPQEVVCVGAGHIRDAANLALAPQQAVVIEFGDAVQVNRVDGDDAAFSQAGERTDHHVAGWGKRDGAIKLDGRTIVLAANPRGARIHAR